MNYTVYKHTCPNGRIYIGITRMKPEMRWVGGMGYQRNKRFFASIVKFGWDNIKHEILEQNLTYAEAKAKETMYIKKFNSNDENFGYNVSLGTGKKGCKLSLEARERLRAAQTGRKATEEARLHMRLSHLGKIGKDCHNSKKVYQYDLDGNFIKEWDSQSDAARFYNCSSSHISSCTRGQKEKALGYIWRSERV